MEGTVISFSEAWTTIGAARLGPGMNNYSSASVQSVGNKCIVVVFLISRSLPVILTGTFLSSLQP